MEKGWLASQLDAGRSFEAIGREVGKHPSTVAYWANKHGLASSLAAKHKARGGIDRDVLLALVERGLTVEQIAAEVGRGPTTVRHWLRRHELRTARARAPGGPRPESYRECGRHGWTLFVPAGRDRTLRCRRCRSEHVSARRRRVKALLVAEAGGRCILCGYSRYAGALHFHHTDPAGKSFAISIDGVARSIARARAEAAKCVLLCGNCHAEVEAGIAKIPDVA